jgi:hypothetical protein
MNGKEDVVDALVFAEPDVNYGTPAGVTVAAAIGRLRSLSLLAEQNAGVSAGVRVVFAGCSLCWDDVPQWLVTFHLKYPGC